MSFPEPEEQETHVHKNTSLYTNKTFQQKRKRHWKYRLKTNYTSSSGHEEEMNNLSHLAGLSR